MNTRTPPEARPPRMEALARLPVFYALGGKSPAAAPPPHGRPSCPPRRAVEIYATEPRRGDVRRRHGAHDAEHARRPYGFEFLADHNHLNFSTGFPFTARRDKRRDRDPAPRPWRGCCRSGASDAARQKLPRVFGTRSLRTFCG
jgi:hypothetical protein